MSIPTLAHEGHDSVMKRMADLFLQVIQSAGMKKEDIGGIGVPGVLDLEKGETLFLPNLPGTWPHIPLQNTITKLSGPPTKLLNDVRSITNGEWRFGAGRGVDSVAVYAIGIGGSVAQAGELLLEPVRRTLREHVHIMPIEQVEVVPSQLGDNAGVIGVACWAAKDS